MKPKLINPGKCVRGDMWTDVWLSKGPSSRERVAINLLNTVKQEISYRVQVNTTSAIVGPITAVYAGIVSLIQRKFIHHLF